jgi:hypothetical protein
MPNGQPGFEYTEDLLKKFEKYISPERLAKYIVTAKGNKWLAIKLYEKNTELSEALYGVIQGFEVTLRNAVHNVMRKELGAENWYDKITLERAELQSIQEAKDKIDNRDQTVTPSRVIAELTFGFWVRLTASVYEKSIWVPSLHKVFPIKLNRKDLYQRLADIKYLRNRIAHHERIIEKRDLPTEYANLLEAIRWLSPDMEAWVKATNCFEERWAKKMIVPKPKPQLPIAAAAAVAVPKEAD